MIGLWISDESISFLSTISNLFIMNINGVFLVGTQEKVLVSHVKLYMNA